LLKLLTSTQFRKDIRKLSKSGSFDIDLLKEVIIKLENETILDAMIHRPHKLKTNWKGYMECHVESMSSNWILIYKIEEDEKILKLARTGTHSELFG